MITPRMSPASKHKFTLHSLEVLVHDVTVTLDGPLEVLQQTHSYAGATRAVFVKEEPSRKPLLVSNILMLIHCHCSNVEIFTK